MDKEFEDQFCELYLSSVPKTNTELRKTQRAIIEWYNPRVKLRQWFKKWYDDQNNGNWFN